MRVHTVKLSDSLISFVRALAGTRCLCCLVRGSLRLALALVLSFAIVPAGKAAERRAEHVFIISFDGGKPAVMLESKMPELMSLVKNGAFTWKARTVYPSVTLPSHTSMLTGLSPEKHKVDWNDWEPKRGIISSPTIFKLAESKHLKTAMFVGKPKFIHLYQKKSLNRFSLPSSTATDAAREAAEYIKSDKPNLCFIHFSDSDTAGHRFGWGSDQQKQSFQDEDSALSTVIDAIGESGIADSSVVILSADHGGHSKTHGSRRDADMVIPWIAWGHGVKEGYQIELPVTTYDTAATALWLLDVPIPANFDGKPVAGAFNFSGSN